MVPPSAAVTYARRALKVAARYTPRPAALTRVQWRQLDLELTAWQMLYMCLSPSLVYVRSLSPRSTTHRPAAAATGIPRTTSVRALLARRADG